jgi:adenylate cyclase
VYLVAPKTFTATAPFQPVPWALAVYLAFTLLRLTLAYRHRLPEWLRYLSIVIDMALLLGMIWSFHLQYQQPPSFYLKSPTLLYVFIFIALRTLNFDARKVLTAGAVAVAGWLVLVAYVIMIDPRDTMITRNYVHYLTSNSVLIGAEVDKVIVILVVTAILAYAIMRNRRLLTYAVTESASNQDLARFVPAEVANLIKTSDDGLQVGSGELREATILFLDLEGFTELSERLAPEDLVRTLNQFYAAVALPLARHDGVINQFQGDAILATFNAPRRNPDHAANAIVAALEIQALLETQTFGDGLVLKARIGINTGAVIHGLIGTPDRLGYTVIGDEVNIAARLEALNKDYGTAIIVSESTRDRAGPQRFVFELLDEARVRGRTAPTRIYKVAGA